MKANETDVLTAKLFFRAAFPAMKVPLTESEKHIKKFKNINAVVSFRADDDANPVSCYIVFLDEQVAEKSAFKKRFKVVQGDYPGFIEMEDGSKLESLEVINMHFKSIKALLGVFKGAKASDAMGILPCIFKNMSKKAFFPFLGLMMELTKTGPKFNPTAKDPLNQYLKVKMSLYLITTALSSANKLAWGPMVEWAKNQSDRIYQFQVGATLDKNGKEIYPPIGAYLRVKAGNTKAGRGIYERKRPFVLFDFVNPDGCLALLTGKYEFVECVARHYVAIIGSGDSYAPKFNEIMASCQSLLVPPPKK